MTEINKEFTLKTRKPVVYIASPYTKGDPAINTRFQCEIFDKLLSSGYCWPVAPLWSHFQHTLFPRDYKDWIAYDLAMISKYDACVRLTCEFPAIGYSVHESSGADGEVQEFWNRGLPVFFNMADCLVWAKRQCEISYALKTAQ